VVVGSRTSSPDDRATVAVSFREAVVLAEPSGVGPDRARVHHITHDGTAVLRVGPGGTELHVAVDELPEGAAEDTWVILDLQTTPPLVIGIDHELTD
jgi:hypothetical protein